MCDSPFMGSIFISPYQFAPKDYLFCQGQLLQVNQNQALYALLGNTFGGTAPSNQFGLPDLRGRVPVGAGQGVSLTKRNVGAIWGAEQATLSINNLPSHDHAAVGTTSLSGGSGSGTVDFSKVTTSATTTVLVENAQAQDSDPTPGTGSYLALPNDPSVGGSPVLYRPAPVGSTPSTFSLGGVSTTVTLSGTVPITVAPPIATTTVAVGKTGSTQPFPMLPPSLALNFIIAIQGLFPMRN